VCREYFSIIFNVKKCALYSIKYGNFPIIMFENIRREPALISIGHQKFSAETPSVDFETLIRQLEPF